MNISTIIQFIRAKVERLTMLMAVVEMKIMADAALW